MTVFLSPWLIPVIATIVLWVAVVLWPIERSRGDYDFGPAFTALTHVATGVIVTLIIWLAWLAFLAFSGGAS